MDRERKQPQHEDFADPARYNSDTADGGWDAFRVSRPTEFARCETVLSAIFVQIAKVATYLVCFILALAGGCVARLVILFLSNKIYNNIDAADIVPDLCAPTIARPPGVQLDYFMTLFFCVCLNDVLEFLTKSYALITQHSLRTVRHWQTWLLEATAELAHSMGICALVLLVLPNIDVISGSLIISAGFALPASAAFISNLLSFRFRNVNTILEFTTDFLALAAQLSVFVWAGLYYKSYEQMSAVRLCLAPVCFILITLRYWPNYIVASSAGRINQRKLTFLNRLLVWRAKPNTQHHVGLLMAVWRLAIKTMFFLIWYAIWNNTGEGESRLDSIISLRDDMRFWDYQVAMRLTYIFFGATVVCVRVVKLACRIGMQLFAFALPISLVAPVCVSVLLALCGVQQYSSPCFLSRLLITSDYWQCPQAVEPISYLVRQKGAWFWLLWSLSSLWIARYVWQPQTRRRLLLDGRKTFAISLDFVLLDVSMLMAKKRSKTLNKRLRRNLAFSGANSTHVKSVDGQCPAGPMATNSSSPSANSPAHTEVICMTQQGQQPTQAATIPRTIISRSKVDRTSASSSDEDSDEDEQVYEAKTRFESGGNSVKSHGEAEQPVPPQIYLCAFIQDDYCGHDGTATNTAENSDDHHQPSTISCSRYRRRRMSCEYNQNGDPVEVEDGCVVTRELHLDFCKTIVRLDLERAMNRDSGILNAYDTNHDNSSIPINTCPFFETHVFIDSGFEYAAAAANTKVTQTAEEADVKLGGNGSDERLLSLETRTVYALLCEACHLQYSASSRQNPTEAEKPKFNDLPVQKFLTPYGGKIIVTLPGGSKVVLHLKDCDGAVRCGRRWSQTMALYYVLGYGIMQNEHHTTNGTTLTSAAILKIKQRLADNTFLILTDGTASFSSHSLQLMLDHAYKSDKVGAVVGRLVPSGSGPCVWMQKFEFSLNHWLQKAAEHVLGSVVGVRSGGCTLFKAKALMDDNVLRKYAAAAQPAGDSASVLIEHALGDESWLATLLIKRGYRVEYSAASDIQLNVPQSFRALCRARAKAFPVHLTQIAACLASFKLIRSRNANISLPFAFYLQMQLIGTLLAPGTIVLTLVASLTDLYKISMMWSLFINVVPLVLAFIVCGACDGDAPKRLILKILCAMYALLMLGVVISAAIQLNKSWFLTSSNLAIFVVAFVCAAVVPALFHPREALNLVYAPVFFLAIPTYYILFVIYSITSFDKLAGSFSVPPDEEDNKRKRLKAAHNAHTHFDAELSRLERLAEKVKHTPYFDVVEQLRSVLLENGKPGGPNKAAFRPMSQRLIYSLGKYVGIELFPPPKKPSIIDGPFGDLILQMLNSIATRVDGIQQRMLRLRRLQLQQHLRPSAFGGGGLGAHRLLGLLGGNNGGRTFGSLACEAVPEEHSSAYEDHSTTLNNFARRQQQNESGRLNDIDEIASEEARKHTLSKKLSQQQPNLHDGLPPDKLAQWLMSLDEYANECSTDETAWLADARVGGSRQIVTVAPTNDQSHAPGAVLQPLPQAEEGFWHELLSSYMYPLHTVPGLVEELRARLSNVRSQFCVGFLIINAMFITGVFLLQLRTDELHMKIPIASLYGGGLNGLGVSSSSFMDRLTSKSVQLVTNVDTRRLLVIESPNGTLPQLLPHMIDRHFKDKPDVLVLNAPSVVKDDDMYIRIQPISVVCGIFFVVAMLMQCITMLMHRWNTFTHVLAATPLACCASTSSTNSYSFGSSAADRAGRGGE